MKLNHVTISISDKDKAIRFYSEVLGLEQEESHPSWVRIGEQFIHLAETKRPENRNHLCIQTKELSRYLEKLKENGVKIFEFDQDENELEVDFSQTKTTQQYFIRDLDRNLIEIISENNRYFRP